MDRIVVSRPALGVAGQLLHPHPAHDPGTPMRTLYDDDVAATLGLRPDTVYRALRELVKLGAVASFTRPFGVQDPSAGPDAVRRFRIVRVNREHWLWATVGGAR